MAEHRNMKNSMEAIPHPHGEMTEHAEMANVVDLPLSLLTQDFDKRESSS
ncbi:hypothetical protein BVRB_8g194960 [Beta vulgaris subsp. vulgaris]|nr:hypothetical protein BVRB_8g194960 [Beta vulgaris subsp. vulgaris]